MKKADRNTGKNKSKNKSSQKDIDKCTSKCVDKSVKKNTKKTDGASSTSISSKDEKKCRQVRYSLVGISYFIISLILLLITD